MLHVSNLETSISMNKENKYFIEAWIKYRILFIITGIIAKGSSKNIADWEKKERNDLMEWENIIFPKDLLDNSKYNSPDNYWNYIAENLKKHQGEDLNDPSIVSEIHSMFHFFRFSDKTAIDIEKKSPSLCLYTMVTFCYLIKNITSKTIRSATNIIEDPSCSKKIQVALSNLSHNNNGHLTTMSSSFCGHKTTCKMESLYYAFNGNTKTLFYIINPDYITYYTGFDSGYLKFRIGKTNLSYSMEIMCNDDIIPEDTIIGISLPQRIPMAEYNSSIKLVFIYDNSDTISYLNGTSLKYQEKTLQRIIQKKCRWQINERNKKILIDYCNYSPILISKIAEHADKDDSYLKLLFNSVQLGYINIFEQQEKRFREEIFQLLFDDTPNTINITTLDFLKISYLLRGSTDIDVLNYVLSQNAINIDQFSTAISDLNNMYDSLRVDNKNKKIIFNSIISDALFSCLVSNDSPGELVTSDYYGSLLYNDNNIIEKDFEKMFFTLYNSIFHIHSLYGSGLSPLNDDCYIKEILKMMQIMILRFRGVLPHSDLKQTGEKKRFDKLTYSKSFWEKFWRYSVDFAYVSAWVGDYDSLIIFKTHSQKIIDKNNLYRTRDFISDEKYHLEFDLLCLFIDNTTSSQIDRTIKKAFSSRELSYGSEKRKKQMIYDLQNIFIHLFFYYAEKLLSLNNGKYGHTSVYLKKQIDKYKGTLDRVMMHLEILEDLKISKLLHYIAVSIYTIVTKPYKYIPCINPNEYWDYDYIYPYQEEIILIAKLAWIATLPMVSTQKINLGEATSEFLNPKNMPLTSKLGRDFYELAYDVAHKNIKL